MDDSKIGRAPRRIIHLDLDAFFCAVEELRSPELAGKPFAVGGQPDQRGVVASCSYPARRFGVRSAMPMSRALRLCPELVIVSGRHSEYSAVSRQVMAILRRTTQQLEQISIDEAFLDVSEHPDSLEILCHSLQGTIRSELGLPCSLGAASNKLVAKLATDVGKARGRSAGAPADQPPCAITIVPAGEEAQFLAPLPVEMLWGVGPKTAERLKSLGIHTIGELAGYNEIALAHKFGKNGYELVRHARGLDDRPVITFHEPKSISQEMTFARDVRSLPELLKTIDHQAEDVARSLQKQGASGSTVKIKLRWPDFTTLTRQSSLKTPTDQAAVISQAARELFLKEWREGKAVRLIGVGVSGLQGKARQLSLWDAPTERQQRLQTALHELEQRFGQEIFVHPERKKRSS
ncbi:MAG TPA: DNA polymerase IV [Anaerolineales bacterium]|nr:DNA polymerase IV [Anaerolineales bacterium]